MAIPISGQKRADSVDPKTDLHAILKALLLENGRGTDCLWFAATLAL